MLDSDEQLTVPAFDALIDTAHDKDRPIVAGLVFAGFGVPGKPYPKPVPAIFQDSDKGFLPLYKYDKNAVFEIDISKFKLKYRLRKDVIGVLDGIDVAMCVEDYEAALNEQRKQSLVEMMRSDEELGLYNMEEQ